VKSLVYDDKRRVELVPLTRKLVEDSFPETKVVVLGVNEPIQTGNFFHNTTNLANVLLFRLFLRYFRLVFVRTTWLNNHAFLNIEHLVSNHALYFSLIN